MSYSETWSPSFLKTECQSVYAKRTTDPKGYELYENEANEFRKFIVALEMLEVKQSGRELCAGGTHLINFKQRKELYKQSNLCDCYMTNNKESFLNCLAEKRKQLVDIIKKY
ncbi:PREDICTED: uncharacterized protein LOC108368681 [Rhagoletis zephyria]|uniref:uncharacterized protein LOC108368681 n=1 Tax=Rhagoletis zephyria TaxID=28612 RepID=UPI00081160C7|nr:PREDICTED: uncharacterized protein LOC108368681 [Rhagoletis zephyria]